jgi:fibronectin type 3 domain-containing protein
MIRPSCTSDVLVASISACGLLALALLAGCGAVSSTKVASDHHVSLTWNASTGAAHYNVYRREISGSYVLIGSTQNLNFTDANVDSGVTFYYVCTAVDAAGRESAFSREARAAIPPD